MSGHPKWEGLQVKRYLQLQDLAGRYRMGSEFLWYCRQHYKTSAQSYKNKVKNERRSKPRWNLSLLHLRRMALWMHPPGFYGSDGLIKRHSIRQTSNSNPFGTSFFSFPVHAEIVMGMAIPGRDNGRPGRKSCTFWERVPKIKGNCVPWERVYKEDLKGSVSGDNKIGKFAKGCKWKGFFSEKVAKVCFFFRKGKSLLVVIELPWKILYLEYPLSTTEGQLYY